MIGNKIAEARKRKNISQAQLAESLFISSQAVGKWERGESMPDITTFNRIAEILGVDLNYFSENFQSGALKSPSSNSSEKEPAEIPSEKIRKPLSWDMSLANWQDADFSGLKNLHEKFSSSNMQRCKFIGSNLSGLLLQTNNVEDCDFSASDISGSHIKSSHIVNDVFNSCRLNEAEFSACHIQNCNFSGTDFTDSTFKSCSCIKNPMTDAVLDRTSFIATEILGTDFNGTLKECSFENCTLKKVTFLNATLINTFFKNTNLKRVKFIECKTDRITLEFLKNGKADVKGITLINEEGGVK